MAIGHPAAPGRTRIGRWGQWGWGRDRLDGRWRLWHRSLCLRPDQGGVQSRYRKQECDWQLTRPRPLFGGPYLCRKILRALARMLFYKALIS
jgi:hypothetical protein